MKSAAEHLRHCYVRQNGRIFPWGTIRLYGNGVMDDGDEYGGLECWSQELVRFGDGNYYAATNMLLPGVLLIFNKKTHMEVATVPFKKIFCAEVHKVKVMAGGFLNAIGKIGMEFHGNYGSFPTRSLQKAVIGERPDQLDNSVFVKVDISLVGQTLIKVSVNGEKYHVFTEEGKAISSKAKKWLCWARWDPENDPIKKPFPLSYRSFLNCLDGFDNRI